MGGRISRGLIRDGRRRLVVEISQTIMEHTFTMIMLVKSTEGAPAFDEIQRRLAAKGEEMQLAIRIQREDIFSAMHTI